VAEHYRQAPPEVMFGVLNEPSRPNLGIDGWNALVAETIPLLRSSNPDRTLLVQTANGGGFGALESLRIPESEHNTIVEVHNYEPGRFTHQQASWSSNRIYKDVHWNGTPEETAAVPRGIPLLASAERSLWPDSQPVGSRISEDRQALSRLRQIRAPVRGAARATRRSSPCQPPGGGPIAS